MIQRKIKYICVLCIWFVSNAIADNLSTQLQQVANQVREKYRLPGFALSADLSDQRIITVYSSDGKENRFINDSSLFQVGSITKSFTAALLIKLIQEHKLNYSDKLGVFFPNYPKWKEVSVIDLMNHTSGIPDYIDSNDWWRKLFMSPSKVWEPQELLNIAYAEPLYFSVGEGWHYSNTNYVLLGMIIEKVSHLPLQKAYLQYLLNTPNNIYYQPGNPTARVEKNLIHGYYQGTKDVTQLNTSWLFGAGTIISNPRTLGKWYFDLFNGKFINLDKITNPSNFMDIKTGHPLESFKGIGYGAGVFTMPSPDGIIWFTPGITSGYTSMVAYLPCKNISLAYVATKAPIDKQFHAAVLAKIMQVLDRELNKPVLSSQYINKCILPITTQQYQLPHI